MKKEETKKFHNHNHTSLLIGLVVIDCFFLDINRVNNKTILLDIYRYDY